MKPATIDLGIVEGFYGRPWTWEAREQTIASLAPHGFRFYLYAPKADASLRRQWREAQPAEALEPLAALARRCRPLGVRFGVGLSPWGFDERDEAGDWTALDRKLAELDGVGVEYLALLFDDMRGDDPDLAQRQARIVARAAARTRATRIFVCPSYYSDDPVLDRAFGERPAGYLERLGRLLDPAIEVFWTGEEVCSREHSPAHLARVAERLGRAPVLWDNYPVNDGQRMSQFLHLRAFTGRPASNAPLLRGHAINPALQPVLSRIPALTLAERYRVGDDAYAYGAAFARACAQVLGAPLGAHVREDLIALQDTGLDRLGEAAARLRSRYAAFDHPGAREIRAWLDGVYRISDEIVRTQ